MTTNYNKVKTEGVERFIKELSDKVRYFASDGQYEKDSPEEKSYLDGVNTATAFMSIDLLGTPKSKGMLSTFAEKVHKATLEDVLEFLGEDMKEEDDFVEVVVSTNNERQRIRDYIKTLTK